MALSTVDSKIQKAITSINAGDPYHLMMCGYLQAMRGRVDTYLSKVMQDVSLPMLVQFIEDKEVMLKNGNRIRTMDFYFFNSIETTTNPEIVRNVHDKIDDLIYEFFRNMQDEGLNPMFVGVRERLIEQINATYDAGIMFQMTIELDARC